MTLIAASIKSKSVELATLLLQQGAYPYGFHNGMDFLYHLKHQLKLLKHTEERIEMNKGLADFTLDRSFSSRSFFSLLQKQDEESVKEKLIIEALIKLITDFRSKEERNITEPLPKLIDLNHNSQNRNSHKAINSQTSKRNEKSDSSENIHQYHQ